MKEKVNQKDYDGQVTWRVERKGERDGEKEELIAASPVRRKM